MFVVVQSPYIRLTVISPTLLTSARIRGRRDAWALSPSISTANLSCSDCSSTVHLSGYRLTPNHTKMESMSFLKLINHVFIEFYSVYTSNNKRQQDDETCSLELLKNRVCNRVQVGYNGRYWTTDITLCYCLASVYGRIKITGFVYLDYICYPQSRVTQARSVLALLTS